MAVAGLLLLFGAGEARANTYPAGGSGFTGGTEGWQVKSASCNVPLLCTASGGYDGADGNPPGSLAASTNIALNLVSQFKSTVTLQSPDFKVADSGPSTVQLDRQFAPTSLVDLAPQLTYTVALNDKTAGTESQPITETVSAASGFVGKAGVVPVTAGHTYAITITAETDSSIAGSGLLAGSTSARFDNVSLTEGVLGNGNGGGNGNGKGANGGKGGAGGNGAGGLSDSQLLALLQSNHPAGTAVVKGKRVFVKAKCPARIGRSCRISLQGLVSKKKNATARRTSKVAKGKSKTLLLKVRQRARAKLARSNRLLFRETVHAGSAKATVYKRLKLIRR
ncbi:MAG TPA: hypothetical protein VHR65_03465 [Solirubrobacterales bacterium]|jgi:hypothetical protein|nr:hypothetical protein [Solirubrobacterales bacterium]